MNHVCHGLLYLRARAMLNSAIHTSTCVGRGGFWKQRYEINLCASVSVSLLYSGISECAKILVLHVSKDSYLFTKKSS